MVVAQTRRCRLGAVISGSSRTVGRIAAGDATHHFRGEPPKRILVRFGTTSP